MIKLNTITILLIEPHSGMRSSLCGMLKQGGLLKVDSAVGASSAIRAVKTRAYDIILCEYDLGEGQDGQQLLEDLRHHNLISLSTIFFMVTAERAYEKVVSAAKLAPTDYLLKPFTADALLARVDRALERRELFRPVHQLMALGNLRDAITSCVAGATTYTQHLVDFMRLRAELHLALGEPVEAEKIYTQLLSTRAIAWARLGLAKTLYMQERFAEAESDLQALVTENSKFMDAYDWLAKTHEAIGQLELAKGVLQDAVSVSPHAVRRLRKLGEVALATGDLDTAENSLRQVVSKARYSDYRDPEDHTRLVQSLIKKGDAEQANIVIRDLDKSMKGLNKTPVCRALSSALVYAHTGDDVRAAQALGDAVAACRDSVGMSNDLKIELVRGCLDNKMDAGASEVMRDLMQNTPSGLDVDKAMLVFEQAGQRKMAEQLVTDSRQHVKELVAAGAEKAKNGDYRGAVTFMTEAVNKLPDNPQVVFNAALAVLKCLDNLGWEDALGKQARTLIDRARYLDATNPRLVPLTSLYQSMLKKYGIRPDRGGTPNTTAT